MHSQPHRESPCTGGFCSRTRVCRSSVGDPGVSWTAERWKAEELAAVHGLGQVRSRTVAKADVLAYLGGYGEFEVILELEEPS